MSLCNWQHMGWAIPSLTRGARDYELLSVALLKTRLPLASEFDFLSKLG